TYDRKKIKIDPALLRVLLEPLYRKPEKWTVLCPDSEVNPQQLPVARQHTPLPTGSVAQKDFVSETGPALFKKGQHGTLSKEFNVSGEHDQIQIRLLAHADVRVVLNGKEIVNKF